MKYIFSGFYVFIFVFWAVAPKFYTFPSLKLLPFLLCVLHCGKCGNTDTTTFTVSKTDSVSAALVNLSLWWRRYQTHHSQSIWWWISQHAYLSEQRRPGSVKAHGKARLARLPSRMWLRKERSVFVLSSPSFPPQGRAAGRGRRPDGKCPRFESHGRRSQHRHCSALWTLSEPDLPHLQTPLCFYPQRLRRCLSLPPLDYKTLLTCIMSNIVI